MVVTHNPGCLLYINFKYILLTFSTEEHTLQKVSQLPEIPVQFDTSYSALLHCEHKILK